MPVFPVHLNTWVPPKDGKRPLLLGILKTTKCAGCDKVGLDPRYAWGHHSITHGHGEIWCSKRCGMKTSKSQRDRS